MSSKTVTVLRFSMETLEVNSLAQETGHYTLHSVRHSVRHSINTKFSLYMLKLFFFVAFLYGDHGRNN